MAEETEGQDTGAEAAASGVDPAAVALALNAANIDPSIAEDARAFLRKQSALIDDQRKLVQLQARELSHELGLRHWSLWVRHASGLLKLALELSVGLLLLFAVTAIGVMVWNAAHADGLIIESFSVPPDLAAKGLTGQVVATQMLDKLTAMQNATGSTRPAQSYANNWGDDLKVEIPDTGVSIGEAYRFLRGWLGHETHVTGEVYRTATGIAVTARSGVDVGATYTGPENDLDVLVQKAAEHVYGITQPFRYANYLFRAAGRIEEARTVLTTLTSDPNPPEQAWAWFGLAVLAGNYEGNTSAAERYVHRAIALNPDIPAAFYTLGTDEFQLDHAEAALAAFLSLDRLVNRTAPPNIAAQFVNPFRLYARAYAAMALGDYANAISIAQGGEAVPYTPTNIRADSSDA